MSEVDESPLLRSELCRPSLIYCVKAHPEGYRAYMPSSFPVRSVVRDQGVEKSCFCDAVCRPLLLVTDAYSALTPPPDDKKVEAELLDYVTTTLRYPVYALPVKVTARGDHPMVTFMSPDSSSFVRWLDKATHTFTYAISP